MSTVKSSIDIWNEPIVHLDEKGIPVSNISLAEMYRELKTPQTPPCLHDWESGWGWSGPIMTCKRCGEWHHD